MGEMAFHGFWLLERKEMGDASHLFDFHTLLILKIFVLVTIRNWIWKMVNIAKNIRRKPRGLADTMINVITLLYTKHIVVDFTVTLHELLQLSLSFCQHFCGVCWFKRAIYYSYIIP